MCTRISAGVSMTALVSLLFITMIPIDCKIILVYLLFSNNYNIGELTSTTSKETMTTNIIFASATPIN